MMVKLTKLTAILISFTLFLTGFSAVRAASITEGKAIFDEDAKTVTVSGVTPYNEGSYVTVTIRKSGDAPIYFREKPAGEKGAFSFVSDMLDTDPTGTYNVYIGGGNLSAASDSFVFINSTDNPLILEKISNISDLETIKTNINYVETTYDIGLDEPLSLFDTNPAVKEQIYGAMLNRSFTDAYQIKPELFKSCVIALLNNGGTKATVDTYADVFGFDLSDEGLFAAVKNDSGQERIYQSILNKGFSLRDTDAVFEAFDKAIYVELINELDTSTRENLIKYITQCNTKSYVDISLAKFNSTDFTDDDRLTVIKEFIKAKDNDRPDTLEEIKAYFAKEIENVENAKSEDDTDPEPQPIGGGGGGGGGRSPQISVTISPDAEEPLTAKPTEVKHTFSDLSNVAWAEKEIEYLAAKGILNGVGDNIFEPERFVKREEFVKIIVEALPLPNETTNLVFADVTEDAWYYDCVMQALACNIINGIDDNNFGTGGAITREQLCTIIYRALNFLNINIETEQTPVTFSDFDSISEYARTAVESLARAEIINGMGDGRFAPKDNATRAMAAKIIYGVLERGNLK